MQKRTFEVHLSVLRDCPFLRLKSELPESKEAKSILLPGEDLVVVRNVIEYLYSKACSAVEISQLVDTLLGVGKYQLPRLERLLLHNIADFEVGEDIHRAVTFFNACSKVYQRGASDDFRKAFRSGARTIFVLQGTTDWAPHLTRFLMGGEEMAYDIFVSQQRALQNTVNGTKGVAERVRGLTASQLGDNEYVKTLKENLSGSERTIRRIRERHDRNHRGCGCAGRSKHR